MTSDRMPNLYLQLTLIVGTLGHRIGLLNGMKYVMSVASPISVLSWLSSEINGIANRMTVLTISGESW
jgi:hypothetical protein